MDEQAMPIYQRIYQELLEQIRSGALPPGAVVPTEKELQRHYQVSRAPVRQALAALEAEGFIRRTPGRGTEVIHPQVAPWARLSGFAHYYSRHADRLTIRTLAIQTVPAGEEVAAHFGLQPGAMVVKITRLRLVEGRPAAYIDNYFAHAIGLDLPDAGDEYQTLHQLIKRFSSREENEVQEDVKAAGAPADVAAVLEIEEGTPVLFVTRRGWDQQQPVEFSNYWARTDFMSYRTFLPNQTPRR